ncbi:cupredoxin domain-containing protein [Kordiimonas aquimaris]|uniref:hypothetical protein n=1 Tax=Kordiimonas aquimaris TaxID=707591 RepID=UPI0021D19984|nr:hypothetical protein [Kordiimonas aquimaris]
MRMTLRKILGVMVTLGTLSSFLASAAVAGNLIVSVSNKKGESLENAVVMLTPQFTLSTPVVAADSPEMRQEGALFSPFVLPVKVGTKVSFPNFDEFRHHVYSFSKTKRFELRLYGKDETNFITFEKPGIVALGCNIHDNMLSYIYVTEAPIMKKTDANGTATLTDLEPGQYKMEIWHPGVKRKGMPTPKIITIADGNRSESGQLDLRRVWGIQTQPAEGQY